MSFMNRKQLFATVCRGRDTSGNLIDFFPMISSLKNPQVSSKGGWISNLGKPKGFEVFGCYSNPSACQSPPDQMLTSSLCTSFIIFFRREKYFHFLQFFESFLLLDLLARTQNTISGFFHIHKKINKCLLLKKVGNLFW